MKRLRRKNGSKTIPWRASTEVKYATREFLRTHLKIEKQWVVYQPKYGFVSSTASDDKITSIMTYLGAVKSYEKDWARAMKLNGCRCAYVETRELE